MGTVDSIYRSKLNEVQSILNGYTSRAGVTLDFAKVLSGQQTTLNNQGLSALNNQGLSGSALYSTQTPVDVSGTSTQYDPMIQSAAAKYGLDPDLLKAVIRVESNFNSDAVSRVGAQGLMQLMPGTASGLGVTDSFDPMQNIEGGAKYLSQQINRFGDVRLALAAYNTGPGRISSLHITDPDNTSEYTKISEGVRGYVDKVMSYYTAYHS